MLMSRINLAEKGNRKKRAVSLIISYVLLISISLALAGAVYAWLKFYIEPGQELKCDDGVSMVIREYGCNSTHLNLTLQNRGLFDFDGYVIKVNNKTGAEIGVYVLESIGEEIKAEKNVEKVYPISEYGKLTFVEVQAFQKIEGKTIFCEDIATQRLSC